MLSYRTPKSIPGLKFWWDASDPSTVNDGRVLQNQNVYKFVDKVSGKALVNFNGNLGPSYSYGAVNSRNAIHFPYHNNINGNLKALVYRVSPPEEFSFDTTNKTIFFVFKPTTTQDTNATKYALSIWSDGNVGGNLIEPNISIRSGPGTNPYSEYVEPDPFGGEGSRTISLKNEKSYQYGLKTSTNPDLNSLQIVICKTGLKGTGKLSTLRLTKFLNLQENGFDSKLDFYNTFDPNSVTLNTYPTPFTITIGGYFYDNLNKFSGVAPMEGFFCEMLYYERYLEDSELFTIGSYLARKWDPIRGTFSLSSIPTGNPPPVTIIINLPSVSTGTSTNITSNSATINNNNVTNNGGGTITARGVVWATTQNPTLSNSFTTDGTGIGTFNSNITSLSPNTLYYARAYATNEAGTSYGTQVSFTTLTAITLTMDVPQDLIWNSPNSPTTLQGTITGNVNNSTSTNDSRYFRIFDQSGLDRNNARGLGTNVVTNFTSTPFPLNWRIGIGYGLGYNVNNSVNLSPKSNTVTQPSVIGGSVNNVDVYGSWMDVTFNQTGVANYDGATPNNSLARLRIPLTKIILNSVTIDGASINVSYRLNTILPVGVTLNKRGVFYSKVQGFDTREGRNDITRLDDAYGNIATSVSTYITGTPGTYYIRAFYSILSGPSVNQEVIVMSGQLQITITPLITIELWPGVDSSPPLPANGFYVSPRVLYLDGLFQILFKITISGNFGTLQTGVSGKLNTNVNITNTSYDIQSPGDSTITLLNQNGITITNFGSPLPIGNWYFRAWFIDNNNPSVVNYTDPILVVVPRIDISVTGQNTGTNVITITTYAVPTGTIVERGIAFNDGGDSFYFTNNKNYSTYIPLSGTTGQVSYTITAPYNNWNRVVGWVRLSDGNRWFSGSENIY